MWINMVCCLQQKNKELIIDLVVIDLVQKLIRRTFKFQVPPSPNYSH